MDLYEYQARELLEEQGIPTPKAIFAQNSHEVAEAADKIGYPCVIKAQVKIGHRGQAGGVKIAHNRDEAILESESILPMTIHGHKVSGVLVAEAKNILHEYYVSISVDRTSRDFDVLATANGGTEVEEIAKEHPEAVKRLHIDALGDFDLAAASKDRGGSVALGGQATINSEADADLTASGQMPARLNGKWRFNVHNGFYQSREKDGQLKGKPTRFDSTGSSGTVTHGLAKSGDFYLKGQDLTVTGGGWVDLNNETLDCNFTVNMKNLPEFPMRMYGSLDNSKTSIGAGKLLLNTLGGVIGYIVFAICNMIRRWHDAKQER